MRTQARCGTESASVVTARDDEATSVYEAAQEPGSGNRCFDQHDDGLVR